MATGGNLVVIDVDPRNGGDKSFRKLVGRREFPATAHARTGGQGEHHLIAVPWRVKTCQGIDGLPGIDVKGEGGYVAVEPSVHPQSKRESVWLRHPRSGIAPCPDWLLKVLPRWSTPDAERAVAPEQSTGNRRGLGRRPGEPCSLAADLIARFPVPGIGHRNDAMVRALGSVIGRGYDDEACVGAIVEGWAHYESVGKIGTPSSGAEEEARRAIRSIRKSPTFQPAKAGGPPPHSIGVTFIETGLWESGLCRSEHEAAFVGGLVVHAIQEAAVRPGEHLRSTHDQIRAIVRERHPDIEWDNKQFDRLKAKYVARISKPPASRSELLVEIEKGKRVPGSDQPGTPSVYRPTGLLKLLNLGRID